MQILDARTTSRLRAQPLTYERSALPWPAVAAPGGFDLLSRTRELGTRDLDRAAAHLLSWRVHEHAGLRVAASAPIAAVDEVVLMRFGVGPASVRVPCRVVQVFEEPDRRGFAYGTLPGHPERGEELFLLERGAGGALTFIVAAYSRPATLLARLGGPVTGAVQRLVTDRYLAAPDRLVS